MGTRKKELLDKLDHSRKQQWHSRARATQRYHWVGEDGPDDYEALVSEILWTIRNGYADQLWSKGKQTAYAVRLSRGDVFVGYDPSTDTLSTWFPKDDIRVQRWVLATWGAASAKRLHQRVRFVRVW